MRGGTLPLALLFASLSFALAFTSPRARAISVVALLGTLVGLSRISVSPGWLEPAFLGCWITIAASGGTVHLSRGPGLAGGVALAVSAGVCGHAVAALSATPRDLVEALAALLLLIPAGWLISLGGSIAIKVASSWLVAIAMLAAVLPFLPVTPGYVPDHLE